ncbi:unnamed protein product, partial [Chrysoparadoxa australica]
LLGPRWGPYGSLARVDKPIGTLLLMWPCWWSTALAAPMGELPDLKLLGLFGVGAFVMRSAGCTINDLLDQDFDKKVARTRERPIASGAISTPQAIAFLGGQLSVGLCVLLQLNVECIKLGFTVMPVVMAYPLMKRVTNWPQGVLGLAMNWGALIGWTAVHGCTSWEHVVPLYGAGVCWTMVYDTLYGHQDKSDDKALGLKSTSLYFGDQTKPVLSCFAVACIGMLAQAGYTAGLTEPFYVALATSAGLLGHQIYSADLDDPAALFNTFRSNKYFGATVMAGIVAGHFPVPHLI